MDSTTDNSFRTLWGIVKAAGTPPEYFVNGSLVDEKDAEALPDSSFADRAHRRFPLTDRANTWASAGYFAKTASDIGYTDRERENVASCIKRAADIYGIRNDVEDIIEKISCRPSVKQASDDESAYCDPEHRGFPVFDKEGAEMANRFFEKHAYKYGHDRRRTIAKNIMRKSAEHGVKVAEQVRLSAGAGFPNRETLAENLLFRANELMSRGTYKMAEELCKFASEICLCSDEDLFRNKDGLFDAIAGMDEVTGLDKEYGKKFFPPEEVLFDVTPESMKEVVDDAVPMGGDTFSAKALSDLPRALFEKVLPKEMVDGMMEDGKISPKKLSVTIISLKSPESSHLKRTIKDFTDGVIDVDDEDKEVKAPSAGPVTVEELRESANSGEDDDEGKDGDDDKGEEEKKED